MLSIYSNVEVLSVLRIFKIAINSFKIIVPILLIITLIIDYKKAVSTREIDIIEQVRAASVSKILAAILIFSIPTFIQIIISTSQIDSEYKIYLDTGRSSLRLILDSLNIEEKTVLLPYYICKVVVEPFIERNYNIYYYDIKEDFSIDEENMFKLIKEVNPSIILINSYFGKEQLTEIRKKLKLQKLYVIEDITHTLLNDNLDTNTSDFIIGSIRKWCAIPDGGVLKNNSSIKINFSNKNEHTEYVTTQVEASLLKDEYINNLDKNIKEKYMNLFLDSKKTLDTDNQIYNMSSITKTLINTYNFEEIKSIRRENYNYLYNNLLSSKFIEIPLGKLDKDTTPLYFPIYISKNRKEFQKYMSSLEMYLPIIWPKDEQLPENNYTANKIYEKIICIPCDQRYNLNDMKRIVDAIKTYERSEKYE